MHKEELYITVHKINKIYRTRDLFLGLGNIMEILYNKTIREYFIKGDEVTCLNI